MRKNRPTVSETLRALILQLMLLNRRRLILKKRRAQQQAKLAAQKAKAAEAKARAEQAAKEAAAAKAPTWEELIKSFSETPRDVATVPMKRTQCKWFYVSVRGDKLCVESGKHHDNPSKIKGARKLNDEDLATMYDFYVRRNNGEKISAAETVRAINQAYWYGIFADLEK